MTVLKLSNITMKYGQYKAVDDVSFKLEKGDFTCLIGPNGSGKSTLIKGIMGLLPYEGTMDFSVKKEAIAYAPQQSTAVSDFPATVKEIVLTGTMKIGDLNPFYSKEQKVRCEEALGVFGIENLANKRTGELSGGQQQRVLLARGYSRNPLLFILDEPDAALDTEMGNNLYNILGNLNQQKGITLLMISHEFQKAQSVCNNVIVINKKLLYSGTVKDYIKEEVCNVF
ncbi:hypothetical protein AZF37_04160 [endosymbiont 'TC1' of Trimyema compressum]|uniref:metal ABC transporter ATP-binding protein n=1 Tax=endosymbiont 'TC1' of Trimyema compressum TaxID=243899 RepID=UPI0007F0857F|nr:metal ABC transporter ATP-binding protein [endosymbiont 'TC1' of Trimyema compressum]AMP20469.1 hypothetical protein AZF37_04160 [endosymbiont 'TC1' of Trimyema compressum]